MSQPIIKTAKESEKGAILLVTVLILAGIMLISFAVATLARRDLRAASDMIRGEMALYAADSGLEEVLYRIKLRHNYAEFIPEDYSNYIDFEGDIDGLQYMIGFTSGSENTRSGSLMADESDQIDIVINGKYDPVSEEFIPEPHSITEINVEWDGDPNAWLEWTIIRWPQDSQIIPFNVSDFEDDPTDDFNNNYTNVTLFKGLKPYSDRENGVTSIALNDLDFSGTYNSLGEFNESENFNYILRLKALYGDISYTVSTNDDNGLPGVQGIQAIGLRGENKRALEISINRTRGAEGFIDYVLYSDETIEKY
ncbi:pilus assembly PilX N-terminal domain-containing protein [Patescibacteria group bacterium]